MKTAETPRGSSTRFGTGWRRRRPRGGFPRSRSPRAAAATSISRLRGAGSSRRGSPAPRWPRFAASPGERTSGPRTSPGVPRCPRPSRGSCCSPRTTRCARLPTAGARGRGRRSWRAWMPPRRRRWAQTRGLGWRTMPPRRKSAPSSPGRRVFDRSCGPIARRRCARRSQWRGSTPRSPSTRCCPSRRICATSRSTTRLDQTRLRFSTLKSAGFPPTRWTCSRLRYGSTPTARGRRGASLAWTTAPTPTTTRPSPSLCARARWPAARRRVPAPAGRRKR